MRWSERPSSKKCGERVCPATSAAPQKDKTGNNKTVLFYIPIVYRTSYSQVLEMVYNDSICKNFRRLCPGHYSNGLGRPSDLLAPVRSRWRRRSSEVHQVCGVTLSRLQNLLRDLMKYKLQMYTLPAKKSSSK